MIKTRAEKFFLENEVIDLEDEDPFKRELQEKDDKMKSEVSEASTLKKSNVDFNSQGDKQNIGVTSLEQALINHSKINHRN